MSCVKLTERACHCSMSMMQEHFKECEKEAKLKPFAKAALAAKNERIDPVAPGQGGGAALAARLRQQPRRAGGGL